MEPLTNFVVTRVIKDFNSGNTIIGGGFTNTHRFFDGTGINSLTTTANTGGVDFKQFFDNKKWFFSLSTSFSMITGNPLSIENLQRSSVHYFQRTDAHYLEVDPTRKSLGGNGGNIQFGKTEGKWKIVMFGLWKSPGFDLNDVGYLRRADEVSLVLWSAYNINEPFSIFRSMRFNTNLWDMRDWGGTTLDLGGNLSVNAQFNNLWFLGFGGNYDGHSISNTMLRGGPSMRTPSTANYWVYANTNDSKKLYFEANVFTTGGAEDYCRYTGGEVGINFKPGKSLSLSLDPSLSFNRDNLQYVTTVSYGSDTRYILATLNQKIAMMSLRINYTITPEMSIQYWGQPFLAAMAYKDFKRVTSPQADNYEDRFHVFQGEEISYNSAENTYYIDENTDGTPDYNFEKPDMNYDAFLSNFVVRWEYNPGSTLFLVWSQTRNYYDETGEFSLKNNMNNLFTTNKPYDIFLIKFTYRFGLR